MAPLSTLNAENEGGPLGKMGSGRERPEKKKINPSPPSAGTRAPGNEQLILFSTLFNMSKYPKSFQGAGVTTAVSRDRVRD